MASTSPTTATAGGFTASTDTVTLPSGPAPEDRSVINDGAEVAARDTTDLVGTGEARETFIPLSRQAIFERLTEDQHWDAGEAVHVRRFYRYLAAWRHLTYMERTRTLSAAYLPFSSDRDTIAALDFTADEKLQLKDELIAGVRRLLECANYREIARSDLNRIFAEDSAYGLELHVDVEDFEELLIFARGATTRMQRTRSWKKLYLGHEERALPIFQRLLLLVKLKDDTTRVRELMRSEDLTEDKARKTLTKRRKMLPDGVTSDFVYLKLFKEIPRTDLKMMFPNTRVRFRLWDKIKLGVTAGGGTLVSIVTTATKVIAALNPVSAVLAIAGLAGVIFRQVMKFFNQRNQYMMVLAQNLYFHTLADNRGVLTLVADRAEEEDIKEEMLLYALIVRQPLDETQFDEARTLIEDWLEREFDVRVRFDLIDALERLVHDGIVYRGVDRLYHARPPQDAARYVDTKWDNYLNVAPFFDDPEPAEGDEPTSQTAAEVADSTTGDAPAHDESTGEAASVVTAASAASEKSGDAMPGEAATVANTEAPEAPTVDVVINDHGAADDNQPDAASVATASESLISETPSASEPTVTADIANPADDAASQSVVPPSTDESAVRPDEGKVDRA